MTKTVDRAAMRHDKSLETGEMDGRVVWKRNQMIANPCILFFLVLFLPVSAAVGEKSMGTALPKPGIEVNRTRTDLDRPTRPRSNEYGGPIVDTHVHLDPPGPDRPLGEHDLKEILDIATAEGIGRLIFMPTPNEGRFPEHERGIERKVRLKKLGGLRIGLFCGGNYLTVWMHDVFHGRTSDKDAERRLARLGQELDGGTCLGTGEIGPLHFNKKGHQLVVEFPMNFEPFLQTVAVTAKKGKWLDLHAEPMEPGGRSREDEVFGGIALMFARNPDLKLILSHTGMTNPTNARRLLETYPNLMMNFKIVRNHGGWRNLEPLSDRRGDIYEDWAKLFEEFPDRFLVGSDAKFGRKGFSARKYRKEIQRLRRLLGALNKKAARMIAHENARRIFGDGG